MFADLLRAQRCLRRHVRSLNLLLFNDLGKSDRSFPRSFILKSARWEWRSQRRGAIRRIRVILLHPFPLSSVGPAPLGAGIYDEGVFGCVGIGRISRIASETPERGSATSRDLLFKRPGRTRF